MRAKVFCKLQSPIRVSGHHYLRNLKVGVVVVGCRGFFCCLLKIYLIVPSNDRLHSSIVSIVEKEPK